MRFRIPIPATLRTPRPGRRAGQGSPPLVPQVRELRNLGDPSETQPRSSNTKIGLQSTFPRATRSGKLSAGRQPETGEAEAFPAPEQNLNPLPSTIFPPHDSFCRALAQCVVEAIRPSHPHPSAMADLLSLSPTRPRRIK